MNLFLSILLLLAFTCSAQQQMMIQSPVVAASGDTAPSVDFETSPTSIVSGTSITITNLTTGSYTSNKWFRGNYGTSPTHYYTASYTNTDWAYTFPADNTNNVRLVVFWSGGTVTNSKAGYIITLPPEVINLSFNSPNLEYSYSGFTPVNANFAIEQLVDPDWVVVDSCATTEITFDASELDAGLYRLSNRDESNNIIDPHSATVEVAW